MRVIKRYVGVALGIAAAAGLLLSGALPASASARHGSWPGQFAQPSLYGLGPFTEAAGCQVELIYAQLAAGEPPLVAADVYNSDPNDCIVFVERSRTAGTNWVVASNKVALPPVPAGGVTGTGNTDLVYDGPGYQARVCLQTSWDGTPQCSDPLSLGAGYGRVTSPAIPASYNRAEGAVNRSTATQPIICAALEESNTAQKSHRSTVSGQLFASTDSCVGWFEASTNGGTTWKKASPVMSFAPPNSAVTVVGVTANYADGPGRIMRVCVDDLAVAEVNCSAGSW